ncbi:MAG: hypothetical protein JNM18_16115 [Planctomycetaceae bacterium]|nr:hypothetical protein [Planctomycetaceae bacterium]
MTLVAACRSRLIQLAGSARRFGGCLVALAIVTGGVADAQEKKIPQPTTEVLSTTDGVGIVCTYFPGTQGKESVPVVLLHEHKKTRRDLESLGKKLQEVIGAAVIIPDLRGHGDSTVQTGVAKKLDATLFRKPTDFQPMVEKDLAAVKLFLLRKNNANELNIDKLAVVGVQMGATIGTSWGQVDWLAPVYLQGKTGQFVKSLVLISPQPTYQGINLNTVISVPSPDPIKMGVFRQQVSVMVICGENDIKAKNDATSILNTFEKGRSKLELESADPAEKTVFKEFADTKLQGTSLLGEASLNFELKIVAFIKFRNADRPYVWEIRKDTQGQPYK